MGLPLYVDLRCLQDPSYAFRGVGHHSAGVLRYARRFVPELSHIVGIVDDALPALHPDYRQLVDRTQTSCEPERRDSRVVFLETSPMTHDLSRMIRFVARRANVTMSLVYDFIPLDFETSRYLPTEEIRYQYFSAMQILSQFDLHAPISNYSRDRLQHYCGVRPDQCVVSGVAIRDNIRAFADPQQLTERFPALQPHRYFFALLGGDSRKNADLVLRAHARFCTLRKEPLALVILGHYTAPALESLKHQYREEGGNPNHLHFISGVTDLEIGSLNRYALGSICPSHIEGFSIPVIESIHSGTPVVVSDIEAHRELVPQAEARFDSRDPDSLVKAMNRLADEPNFRELLLSQQAGTPARFTEEKVAGRVWKMVRSRLLQTQAPGILPPRMSLPRIAVLSPYPPDRSGVADYTATSLEKIAERAIVDVYTNCPAPRTDPWIRSFAPISRAPYYNGEYDLILPVVGNSHFHTEILELHKQFGGPCLIHDNRLAELYAFWHGPEKLQKMVKSLLNRDIEVAECQRWLDEPWRSPSPFFDEVLERANPVIFHSRGIQRRVRKLYQRESAYLPFCCYRTFSENELTDSARFAARKKLGLPQNRLIVSTFGIVDRVKGPAECIWAIEMLRSWGIEADLHFVGSANSLYPTLRNQAETLGLERQIHFHEDWISDEDYRQYVIASDIGIQLRTHGFGGLSGAMLDCIGSGMPTVSNENLAESLDSPDYVLRVPDHFSPVLIAERIYDLVTRQRHRLRLSPDRSRYVEEHSFERYATEFMRVLSLAS
jgi:glycosyltransferase involved in cell wall biosynthesis